MSLATPATSPKKSIAAVVHLFYEEMWDELAGYVRNIGEPFTLYVTLPEGSRMAATVARDFTGAIIKHVPNVGRDVAPFFSLFPEIMQFDLVCKIHSKRELAWRQELLDSVLGSSELVTAIVTAFDGDSSIGMIGSGVMFLDGPIHTQKITRQLMLPLFGGRIPRYGFFGGTIFWLRPKDFVRLAAFFKPVPFVPHADRDGRAEHVAERLFGVEMARPGRKVGLVYDAKRIEIVRGDYRGTVHYRAALQSRVR